MKSFKDLLKSVKGIKYRTEKDWEIFLPHKTSQEKIRMLIEKLRETEYINWHLVFPEPTVESDEPEIRMWWDVCIE